MPIYASVDWVSIGSGNVLLPLHQAIMLTNAALLSIGHLGTNFSEIWNKIQIFHSFGNAICKMAAMLSRGRLVNMWWNDHRCYWVIFSYENSICQQMTLQFLEIILSNTFSLMRQTFQEGWCDLIRYYSSGWFTLQWQLGPILLIPDSKFHGANMGPIWGRQSPGGPNVGPMNLAVWDVISL